jgi:hypothetical protein
MHIMRSLILLILTVSSLQVSLAQTPVSHWETVVYDSMVWRYWPGTADPGSNWFQPGFNDSGWQQGRGGVGYADGDDRTTISPVLSVFIRKKFTITNADKIVRALLHADFDDGFIAYLNGVEIARAFMPNQTFVPFNQGSAGLHEATLYQGIAPDAFALSEIKVRQLLVNGENTLAVQVHNDNIGSSDLSSNMFFSVGVSDNSFTYLPTPTWFTIPQEFESSNLPIVMLNTNGQTIIDEPEIIATMGIIDNGTGVRNNVSDPPNNYNGRISIEVRGESSQMFPKKSYTVETQDATGNNLNVPLLGMPAENDWVLYAPYTDKSLMRDVLAFEMGRLTGRYAPRTRFVELVLNGNYEGVYVLIERIKIDRNRVDIATLNSQDITGLELTGGYLLRVDKIDANDYPGWRATPDPQLPGENDIVFQYYRPQGEELMPQQRDYIRNYITKFQSSLTNISVFLNPNTGYKKYLDIPAAIDFMIVNEVGKNIDGYIFSTYLYKDKDRNGAEGKLVMGPLWDFNLAYGNVDYWQNAQFAPGWMYNDQYRMFWFRRMMEDPYFAAMFNCRWKELRSNLFSNANIDAMIDNWVALLQESQERNYKRWPILGTYVWPNQFVGQTYEQEINFLKTWIRQRLVWMDTNIPGDCNIITAVNEKPLGIEVFPNPFSAEVRITVPVDAPDTYQLRITNIMGKEILLTNFSSAEFVWDGISTHGDVMPAGVYIVTVKDSRGGVIYQQRLIKG